jgi:hypothetical protein
MSKSMATLGETVWVLPPLILHPFNERVPPSALLENSKAALMLTGLIPNEGASLEQLEQRVLAGRYCEIRMLFYVGKDVFRWLDQCVEWAASQAEFQEAPLSRQSFAALLISSPPEPVKEKLIKWGVVDFASIFSRAIGLNAMFSEEPPSVQSLSLEFLRCYHRYADALFRCYMDSETHAQITPQNFHFDLYASGEYARILEEGWGA